MAKKTKKRTAAKVVKSGEELLTSVSQSIGVHPTPNSIREARDAGMHIANLLNSGERSCFLIKGRLKAIKANFADLPADSTERKLAEHLLDGLLDRADRIGYPPDFQEIRDSLTSILHPKQEDAGDTAPAAHPAKKAGPEEMVA